MSLEKMLPKANQEIPAICDIINRQATESDETNAAFGVEDSGELTVETQQLLILDWPSFERKVNKRVPKRPRRTGS